jgi:hypothetical protein
MDLRKIIGTAVSLGTVGPTKFFSRHSCSLLKTCCTEILSTGGMVVPLGSAVSPKISKTTFLSFVYLLNVMMKTNLESKHD